MPQPQLIPVYGVAGSLVCRLPFEDLMAFAARAPRGSISFEKRAKKGKSTLKAIRLHGNITSSLSAQMRGGSKLSELATLATGHQAWQLKSQPNLSELNK